MTQVDFEKFWRAQFARNVEAAAGREMRERIMVGDEVSSLRPDRWSAITWTIGAIQRLDQLLDKNTRIDIMTGCACQYPKGKLRDIKKAYRETGELRVAHQMLQEKFIVFLHRTLGLTDDSVDDIIGRGWGLAGVIQDDAIIATKIPKSGYLRQYLEESDTDKKRSLYCHCPRVRTILETRDAALSSTYCYCGAGFYKGIWEEILDRRITIRLLKTVIRGDDVCQFKVIF
jgi:predicted hydrocarbon binding protein